MESFLWPVVAAFIMTWVAVPLLRALAWKLNIVDKPAARKLQVEAVPLLGGLGFFIPFVISLLFFYKGSTDLNLKAVVFCSALMVGIGFWDDKAGMSWRIKLLGQILISTLLVWGFGIQMSIFYMDFLNIVLSVGWLVFITNSLNLMDNMDGLSAGISAIAAFFFFLLAYRAGQPDLAMFCVLLAACLMAFLKYNFSPASIFMGDSGSLFLGFTLGAVAILLQAEHISGWAIFIKHEEFLLRHHFITEGIGTLIPLLVLAVPIFDTLLVMVFRTLNGLGIFTPGRDHSSHRLSRLKGAIQRNVDKIILNYIRLTDRRKKTRQTALRGISQTRTVLILYACAGILGGATLILSQLSLNGLLVLAVLSFLIALFSAHKLGQVLVYKNKK